ncbi:amidase [bacterium]|nr:amidase [bacterium]
MNRRRFAVYCASAGLAGTLFPEALTAVAHDRQEITVDMIASAEKIAGLVFTEAERESMVKILDSLGKTYDYIRTIELGNSVPPALVFNPALPGMKFPAERKPFHMSPVTVKKPARIEDAAYYPVTHLAKLIETRQVTSTDLTNMYLSRLKKYDPILHCVVTLTEELALRQAKKADEEIAAGKYRGILHGIPYGIKDLFAVRGYRTTWGSEAFKDRIIDMDATVVTRLTEAGAVLIAKLATGAFASGENWFGGKTRNPWKPDEGSSGSSAGPGSATAAGLVGFAVGTETRGSIAGPSERCGVTGLRPTFGRISRYGAMALSWSMDKVGPLCRTAEDCAVVFNALYGPDGFDHDVVDLPFNWNSSLDASSLRVGYVRAEFEGTVESVENRARTNMKFNNDTLDVLRSLGVKLVPMELPECPADMVYLILFTEGAAAFDFTNPGMSDMVESSGERLKRYPAYHLVPAVDYIQANRARTHAMKAMEAVMADIDAYVTPTFVGPTNWLTNITGHPEVIVPHGFNERGCPVSISFVGRLYDEATLLALARTYQNATGFHLKHPSL